jgi:outer membrane protein assembly factor BamB
MTLRMHISPSGDRASRSRDAVINPISSIKGIAAIVAIVILATVSRASAQPSPSAFEWPTLGGGAARSSLAVPGASASLGSARWVRSQMPSGEPIVFAAASGVVATAVGPARLFAVCTVAGQPRVIAIDAESGGVVWLASVPALQLGSWSTPTLDSKRGTVLVATGSSLIALRQSDGSQAWRVDLSGAPVNVSPVVTDDLGPADRALVTTDGGFGGPSWLVCINVSERDEVSNPFDPGDVVWSGAIGSSVGATPAYLDGVAYVASTGLDGFGIGEIRAFDVRASGASPEPLWLFTNAIAEGFFGGVCVREDGVAASGGGGGGGAGGVVSVYAASYAFFGGLDSSNVVKLRASDGALVWFAASNRTSSIPVVLDDGRVLLSTGVWGFGSVPSVQLFSSAGALLWDSAIATWNDASGNNVIDVGEFTALGGWNTQPVLMRDDAGGPARAVVGTIALSGSAPNAAYSPLAMLNLGVAPSAPGFVASQSPSAGATAAVLGSGGGAGAGVYSVGPSGLSAFGALPPRGDLSGDLRIDIEDVYRLEQLAPTAATRDVDRSGVVNDSDRQMLLREARRDESRRMARDAGKGVLR